MFSLTGQVYNAIGKCIEARSSVHRLWEKFLRAWSGDPEFQVAQLNARLAELQALNLAAIQARIKLNDARIDRNHVVHGPRGVVDTTRPVKDFFRAKFGFFSPQASITKPSMNA